jgi:nanoRNase/pAp phosphatase (c-di-AMP/oligoRNAs hydrolase)
MKAPVPSAAAAPDSSPRARARAAGRPRRVTLRARSLAGWRDKLDKLVSYARGHRRALILTHDNPDPDSIAAGVALAWLLEELAGVEAKVAYGGIVGRAENRALIRILKLPVVPVSRVVFDDYDLICMVDTQPEQGNHSLPPRHFPDVVIDHHPERPDSHLAAIADVGGPIGATSTVVVEYLRASRLDIPPAIATALFYGVKADTRDLGRQTTPQDVEAYLWLYPRADKEALGEIEHPSLPACYFLLSHTAIEQAVLHGDAVVIPLGPLYAPDMVAEVAERFLYLEGMRWSLAWGEYEGDLYYSIRTRDRRANAGRLIREIIEARGGSAGGHGTMAGARLPLKGRGPAAARALAAEVAAGFLAAFGVRGGEGKRLLALRKARRPAPKPARARARR